MLNQNRILVYDLTSPSSLNSSCAGKSFSSESYIANGHGSGTVVYGEGIDAAGRECCDGNGNTRELHVCR